MVPKKGGWGHESSRAERVGYHDNPVSGSNPPGTVTLTSQWKHNYLPHTYHDKREGWDGNKGRVRTNQANNRKRMT